MDVQRWTMLSLLLILAAVTYGEDKPQAVPQTLPGVIPSIAYKKGGEGVGYHDTSKGYGPFPGGHGGQAWKRGDDVEIDWAFWDRASDGSQDKTHWAKGMGGSLSLVNGGDFSVWMDSTEWLAYDVIVEKEAEYFFVLRMAYGGSAKPAPTFHLELDGKPVGAPLMLPSGTTNKGEFSNPWHHYYDVFSQPVKVSTGSHLLKVVCDQAAKDGLAQLHYIEVKAHP